MQIGPLDIPLQDIVFLIIIIFLAGRWYVQRLVNVNKVKALFISKDGLDARFYSAEDSINENKVVMKRPKGLRSKPEEVAVERSGPALNLFSGSRRDIIYKIVDGEGKTSPWITGGKQGVPSLLHAELAKAQATISALGAVALKNTMSRVLDIVLGFSLGAMVFMALVVFNVI